MMGATGYIQQRGAQSHLAVSPDMETSEQGDCWRLQALYKRTGTLEYVLSQTTKWAAAGDDWNHCCLR